MSIGPSNWSRSISNFDITFTQHQKPLDGLRWKFQWLDFRRSEVIFGDFEIGFNIGKSKVRVRFHCLTVRSFYILDMFEIYFGYDYPLCIISNISKI